MDQRLIILGGIIFFWGSSPALAQEPSAEEVCEVNAYIDDISHTQNEEIITCACAPGYERGNNSCNPTIPTSIMNKLSPFLPRLEVGQVKIYYEDKDGVLTKISPKKMFFANAIILGSKAQFKAYVGENMRLSIEGETDLRLGEVDIEGENHLYIKSLKGSFRLDNHLSEDERKWLSEKIGRTRSWFKKAMSRRFKARTPTAGFSIRGSDIIVDGLENGKFKIKVISGIVDIYNQVGDLVKTIQAGEETVF